MMLGGGEARDHATFMRLRADGAAVRYALLGPGRGNAILRRAAGVTAVDSGAAALELAAEFSPKLVLVQRPELLIDGIADVFRAAGHSVLGAGAELARLEAAKSVSKQLLARCGVPTPDSFLAADAERAVDYLRTRWRDGAREYVVKSDRYLSDAALGTTVPATLDEAIDAVVRVARSAGGAILLEERIYGQELSLHLLLDGRSTQVCPLVSDYKTLCDGDIGPNTHGMGAVAVSEAPSALSRQLDERIVRPLALGLPARGMDYRGVLYVGVIVTDDGPQVLELNVRPGNPEWIALLALLESPLDQLYTSLAEGSLASAPPRWRTRGVSGVAFATVPGYPGEHAAATAAVTLPESMPADMTVVGEGIADHGAEYCAGTGRSLALVAVAPTIAQMRRDLYAAFRCAGFSGMHYRRDIGLERTVITGSSLVEKSPEQAETDHAGTLRGLVGLGDRGEARSRVSALTESLISQTGKGLQLGEAKLDGLDLSGFDLRRAHLNRAQLYGTDLSAADLSEASLICPLLERTKFAGAILRGAYVHAFAAQVCDFTGADFSGITDGTGALFHGCNFRNASLSGSMLSGSSFYQTTFDGATLAGANLEGCQFLECSAVGASFERTQLDGCSFNRVALTRAAFTGAGGENVVIQRPFGCDELVLSHANLPGLRMIEVQGERVLAGGLRARGADLRDCSLPGSDFADADLAGSSLVRVNAHRRALRPGNRRQLTLAVLRLGRCRLHRDARGELGGRRVHFRPRHDDRDSDALCTHPQQHHDRGRPDRRVPLSVDDHRRSARDHGPARGEADECRASAGIPGCRPGRRGPAQRPAGVRSAEPGEPGRRGPARQSAVRVQPGQDRLHGCPHGRHRTTGTRRPVPWSGGRTGAVHRRHREVPAGAGELAQDRAVPLSTAVHVSLGRPDLLAYPRGVRPSGVTERRVERAMLNQWLAAAESYGYLEVGLPSLAYAKSFASGHSAAGERVYQFPDRSGRELTLVSDGFIAWVQAVCAVGSPEVSEHRVSYLCPIYRYRKSRRRAFHQMGIGYLRLGADEPRREELAELLRVVDRFAAACRAKFTVQLSHPGMWRTLFEMLGSWPRRPVGQLDPVGLIEELTQLPVAGDRLAATARTGKAELSGVPGIDQTVTRGLGELAALAVEVEGHCPQLTVTTSLADLHAAEFYRGVSFQLFTETGFRLGDGGDCSALAGELLGQRATCASLAFGFENVATELDLPDPGRRLMLATLGDEPTQLAGQLAADLRAAGWDVTVSHTVKSVARIRRAAQAVGIDKVVILGPREIRDGTVSFHDLRSDDPPTAVGPGGLTALLKQG